MRFLILFLLSTTAFAYSDFVDVETNTQQSTDVVSVNETDTRYYSLAGTITQPQPHNCFVPKKGRGRSWSALWGMVQTSGLVELDPEGPCWVEYKAQNEHIRAMETLKLEIARFEAENENLRLKAEVAACRQREACRGDK